VPDMAFAKRKQSCRARVLATALCGPRILSLDLWGRHAGASWGPTTRPGDSAASQDGIEMCVVVAHVMANKISLLDEVWDAQRSLGVHSRLLGMTYAAARCDSVPGTRGVTDDGNHAHARRR
jgi:hypothetical protein